MSPAANNMVKIEASSVPSAPATAMGRRRRKPQTPATVRRNERERNRVRHVNSCFTRLRQFVSAVGLNGQRRHSAAGNKRLSKVDTLRAAISYIRQLQTVLNQADGIEYVEPQNYSHIQIADLEPSSAKRKRHLAPIDEQHFSESDELLDQSTSSDNGLVGGYQFGTQQVQQVYQPAPKYQQNCQLSVGTLSNSSSPYYTYSPPIAPVPTFSTNVAPNNFSFSYYNNHGLPQQQQQQSSPSPCSSIASPVQFHGVPQQHAGYNLQHSYYWQQQTQQPAAAYYCR